MNRSSLWGFMALGVLGAAIGFAKAPDRMWASWLLLSHYGLGLGLAGLCFVAIAYATGASWSVAIRRVPEALAGTVPFAVLAMAVVLVARPGLYSWTTGIVGAGSDATLAFKRFWLDRPFFLARGAFYALTWTMFALAIRRRSRRQDDDHDSRWTRANIRLSAAFLVVFAVTFTLASFDWLMSLEPGWYSTIFGVYNFAGLFLSGLAATIVVALWLERVGPLRGILTAEHLHDLGKLLFAFSTFWMYIWFSQYMLIWYTNIPAEAAYFSRRMNGGWLVLSLLNVALNWVVPFFALIRRDVKRDRALLGAVCVVVLAGRWVDLYLMIFPSLLTKRGNGVWEACFTGRRRAIQSRGRSILRGLPRASWAIRNSHRACTTRRDRMEHVRASHFADRSAYGLAVE